MFTKVLSVILVLLLAFLVYVGLKPAEMHITKEIVINAPAEDIFPHINNSEKANTWMPWKELDPKLHMTYSGPEEGVGSASS